MQNLHNIHAVTAIAPASVADNTAAVSAVIDTFGYAQCEFLITLGAIADADATFAVTLEHGDAANLSDTAAVTAANLQGALADAGFQFDSDNGVRRIGYLKAKRYVRLTVTPTANSGSAIFGVTALLGAPTLSPTPNP